MFENPRRGKQARNFTTNVPKTLDLKSSSEQIFSRKLLSANFETHTLQNDFVVFFRLGVKDENGQALFSSLEAFTSKIQGKTVSTILVDHDFCQIA